MWALYFSCLVPIFVGTFLFFFSKKVVWWEWLIGSAAAFLVAGIVHQTSFNSQTADFETWSGQIAHARQFSAWQEYYEEAIYRTEYYSDTESYTDSKGRRQTRRVTKSRRVFDHWEPRSRWHSEYFTCYSNINTSYSISKDQYNRWKIQWQNERKVRGDRSTFEHNSRQIGGDPFDYETSCPNSIIEPIHCQKSVVNRLKAAQSVFNFVKVSPEKEKLLFKYPESNDPFSSNRVLGTAASKISTKQWDILNAKLGPIKKVNLIIVGFDSSDHTLAESQKALWIGGKKNDLVLVYGNGWSRVFGWSDSDILKRDLEQLLLQNPVGENLLPEIERLILAEYEKTNWHKFDHLSVEPNGWAWFWFWFCLIITQVGLWAFFHGNGVDKFKLWANL
jgi:hypothetical protein